MSETPDSLTCLCDQCDAGRWGVRLSAATLRLMHELIELRAAGQKADAGAILDVIALLDRAMTGALETALTHARLLAHPNLLPVSVENASVGVDPVRTYLNTAEGMEYYAARFGASLEAATGRWYVDGDVPGPLLGLLPREKMVADSVACPICKGPMVLRNTHGPGDPFYGCKEFPYCKGRLAVSSGEDDEALPTVGQFLPPISEEERPLNFTNELSRLRHLAVTGATAAFGGSGKLSADWLTTHQTRLDGESPLKALGTIEGAHRVLTLIEGLAGTKPPAV